mgnify:CR=1 FL=1
MKIMELNDYNSKSLQQLSLIDELAKLSLRACNQTLYPLGALTAYQPKPCSANDFFAFLTNRVFSRLW